jgi:hypothetical protein
MPLAGISLSSASLAKVLDIIIIFLPTPFQKEWIKHNLINCF